MGVLYRILGQDARESPRQWRISCARRGCCPLRGKDGLSLFGGSAVPLHIRGCGRCSFPLAGKNQRATGGSQIEPAPWLPPDPSSLGLRAEPLAVRGYWLPRGGGLERLGVLCQLSAGGRAAPVGCPRCARVGGPVGRVTACRLAWRDRSETVRFSAAVHGRRSWSSLRRPPQEVAASLDHGGAHNPHAKRGDRRGAPPERNQPSPLPRRGRCHGESRDG